MEDTLPRSTLPVFLTGCHRSGTTLLRYILDAHPRLACPPESKFISGLEAFLAYPQSLRGIESLGVSPDVLMRELRVFILSLFSVYTSATGKPRWIDKTPNYARLLPLLDRIFDGRVLYVLVVRHPLDVIDSLERSPVFARTAPEDPDIAFAVSRFGSTRRGWASHWTEINVNLAQFIAAQPSRCHVVSYEHLVARTAAVVSDVCRFIGEEYADDLISRAFSQEHREGYGDWKIRASSSVHADSIGKWRQWRQTEIDTLWEIVGPTAAHFGYARPADGTSAQ